MPSDRPPSQPRPPGSNPAGRRRTTAALRDGTLAFALVLAAFVAYALGAPATYRATAIVTVDVVPGSGRVELPKAAEASELLRRAALDPAVVSRLANQERAVPPETAKQSGARISSALSVESSDGRSFTFATTGSSAERAQYLVNELSQQAAKRAVQVLDPQPPQPQDPGARAKAELLEFLAAHPGIASEPSTAPTRPGPDPLVLALRAEKTRIEAMLAGPPAPQGDNPYDDIEPLQNPESLKRRLKEIDSALEARAKPPAPRGSASAKPKEPSAEARAEWQRLLRAVSEARSVDPAKPPAPRLRVTLAGANLPRSPIEPDRQRLVLLGVMFASLAAVLAGVLRSVLESRAVRRYGMITGEHPVALPQTTLRLSRDQLPKPAQPKSEPLPTPVPMAPPNTAPITPIPPAPLVPTPITPIPPVPIAPIAITPIPPVAIVPTTVTPVPPAPTGGAPTTPIPPRTERFSPLAPTLIASVGAAAPLRQAPTTPTPPAPVPLPTPIPPAGVPPPSDNTTKGTPLVIQGPGSTTPDGPPTTQAYGEPEKKSGRKKASRRTTKIYGTPPAPTLEQEAKALNTTQTYGSPPVAIPPPPRGQASPIPFEAEVLPPEHKSSLRPTPMIPVARTSSAPPPVTPATRSGVPLTETGYSYVQTPVPEAYPETYSIPQTPHPRRPSPPPRTEPYGSLPPVQPRASHTPPQMHQVQQPVQSRSSHPPPQTQQAQHPSPPTTPTPPPPAVSAPAVAVRTHPVATSWRPDAKLAPARKRPLAAEILTLAVERCLVIGVTGTRGSAEQKSIAAAELALALSEAKHPRVLLVESDFHFPQVQKWLSLDVPFTAGFSQQLRGRMDGGRDGRWHVVECKASLHVLAEGVMRSPGLLLSNQFEQAMRELRGHYDVIVIDAPIAPTESDGQAISDVVDGAVVVGPASRASEIMEVSRIFSGKKLLRVVES